MKTLLLLAVAAFVQVSWQETCHLREIESCSSKAVNFLRGNPVPQNEEQVEEQCKIGKEAYDCVTNYTEKCTSKLQRELISFATEGARASFDEYCTPGSNLRKSILEKSECLSQVWEEQRSCMNDAQAGIEFVSETPAEKRVDVLCCTYNRYRKCGTKIAREKCGNDAEEWIEKISGMIVSNLPNLVCNSCENDEAKCKDLLPAPGTKPKGSASDSPIGQLLGIYFNN